MLSKLKGKFAQQPLQFDDLENILPADLSVDYEDVDDVDAKDLFSKADRKGSFSSKMASPSTRMFGSSSNSNSNNESKGLGPRKNSFNKLFMNSPSNNENMHPNQAQEKNDINVKMQRNASFEAKPMDVFKMRGLAEALPQTKQVPVSPSHTIDDRFASTRPTRDSPTASSSSARAPNVFSQFQQTPHQPLQQASPPSWSPAAKQPGEEKSDYYPEDYYQDDTYYEGYYQAEEEPVAEEYSEVDVETLFSKVRHNHTEYVAQQLSSGVDPNITDAYGNTMLHVCAQNNNKKVASLLLTSNGIACDVNAVNKKNHTPLDYAVKYGHQKLAAYFQSHGAGSGLRPSSPVARTASASNFR